MRIFLAGGSGLIGSRLIPALISAGHEVVATTRREDKLVHLSDLGAEAVAVDVYDRAGVVEAVRIAAPDAVLHEMTDLRDSNTQANARLRRDGTANLVAATNAAGVGRMIAQSIVWAFPDGDRPAAEDDPLLAGSAVEEMERLVLSVRHPTVLRYGMLYGPGTWYAPGGRIARSVLDGRVPATPAITCFVHIDDVVAATVSAIDWPEGIYHVTDDEPAPATVWLPFYAAGLGAPEPRAESLPEGSPSGRAVSNAKAKRAGWAPRYPTWRMGFPQL